VKIPMILSTRISSDGVVSSKHELIDRIGRESERGGLLQSVQQFGFRGVMNFARVIILLKE